MRAQFVSLSCCLMALLMLPGCGSKSNSKKPARKAAQTTKDKQPGKDGGATKGSSATKDGKVASKKKTARVVSKPDAGWGTLRGRFVAVGDVSALPPLNTDRDQAFCGKFTIPNETVVLGEQNGVANIVVRLRLGRNEKPPQAHPGYAKSG